MALRAAQIFRAEQTRFGVVWVALGASLWGFDSLLRRLLTRDYASSTIVLLEHLILALILAPALYRSRRAWMQLSGKEWGAVLGLSWGGSALGTVCFTQAVKLGSATTAVLLQELQPLFAALLSGLLLGELEPRRPIYWMRTAVALTAAYFISFGDDMYWPSLDDVRGQSALLAVLAAAIWGASTVFGRYAVRTLSPLAMTALRITVALPLLALLNGLGQSSLTVPAGVRQWGILATMALVPGLAALVAYYYGLRRTYASLATLAELCFPAGAVLINWVFLGERISPLQAGAVALLWVAVLWGRGGPKDRGAAPLPPESRA